MIIKESLPRVSNIHLMTAIYPGSLHRYTYIRVRSAQGLQQQLQGLYTDLPILELGLPRGFNI